MDHYCDNLYNISESAVQEMTFETLSLQSAECLAHHFVKLPFCTRPCCRSAAVCDWHLMSIALVLSRQDACRCCLLHKL